nr:MAG TPA: hypothetical protein [Caudoviricetes sp.]
MTVCDNSLSPQTAVDKYLSFGYKAPSIKEITGW